MKKFLNLMFLSLAVVIAFMTLPAVNASAQDVYVTYKTATDTTTNQDTTYLAIPVTKGTAVAAQVTVEKITGTQHGTVKLEGNIDGNWVSASSQSMTLSDQDVNSKVLDTIGTFLNYRAVYITPSGTQKSLLKFSVLRQYKR